MNCVVIKENVLFEGWPNCIEISNAEIKLIATTDIGPRILFFGYKNSENLLYVNPEQAGLIGGDTWRIYGGHRLWLSPEIFPETYTPDNDPVQYSIKDNKVVLTQNIDSLTGIVKEIEISVLPDKNEVLLHHRLTNEKGNTIEVAPWAITAFAPNGYAIIPQELFIDENDFYLPARPIVLWHYVKMNDKRFTWGDKYIISKQDPSITAAQKIGVFNRQKWAAYYRRGELLIKQFDAIQNLTYPDFGCNNEVYFNDKLIEIETLGSLIKLMPGLHTEHTERWILVKVKLEPVTENEIEDKFSELNEILPKHL